MFKGKAAEFRFRCLALFSILRALPPWLLQWVPSELAMNMHYFYEGKYRQHIARRNIEPFEAEDALMDPLRIKFSALTARDATESEARAYRRRNR